MAIAYRAGSNAWIVWNTLTVSIPSGVQAGDGMLLLLQISASNTYTLTVPSGWTQIGSTLNDGGNGDSYLYWRAATSSDPGTSFDITTDVDVNMAAVLVAYSGIDTSALVHAWDVTQVTSGSGTTSHVTPTVTTSVDGSLVVEAITARGSTVTSWTVDSAIVKRQDVYGEQSGAPSIVAADNDAGGPAGTYGGHTFTSDVQCVGARWTIALQPLSAQQTVYPDEDVTTADWTPNPTPGDGVPMASLLADQPTDDSRYIESPSSPTGAVLEVGLGTVADPGSSGEFSVNARLALAGGASSGSVQVDLMEGSTSVGSATFSPTGTVATYTFAVPVSAVSDRSSLRLRFTVSAS